MCSPYLRKFWKSRCPVQKLWYKCIQIFLYHKQINQKWCLALQDWEVCNVQRACTSCCIYDEWYARLSLLKSASGPWPSMFPLWGQAELFRLEGRSARVAPLSCRAHDPQQLWSNSLLIEVMKCVNDCLSEDSETPSWWQWPLSLSWKCVPANWKRDSSNEKGNVNWK